MFDKYIFEDLLVKVIFFEVLLVKVIFVEVVFSQFVEVEVLLVDVLVVPSCKRFCTNLLFNMQPFEFYVQKK